MTEKTDPLVYLNVSLPCIPRLLGLLDRNPLSASCGCFDRTYWHYRTTDFSNGRQQEAALTLALLYTIDHPSNPYGNQEKIRKWSTAAMQYLETIQNTDGSFNEYYPHEHAFVTTAFVTFAASEALLVLNERPPDILETLTKAGKFLLKREELEVINQNLGACAALQNLYILTGDERFERGAREKLRNSLSRQSEEGWFYEYGGPDIGYLSVAVSYLAHYFRKTKDESAFSGLKRAVYFLSHFQHPDGTAGGEYGSRNTAYVVPDGIEICAQSNFYASYLADQLRKSLVSRTGMTPSDLDDRYLCTMLYTYLQAFKNCSPVPEKKLPESNFFSESGLLVEKSGNYLLIGNLRKGGIFKIFCNDKLILSDSGFLGRLSNGKMVTSQWLGTSFTRNDSEYIVTGNLVSVAEQYMTPLRITVLRASLSIGRNHASDFAKKYLRRQLITKKSEIPVTFQRKITFKEGICIEDQLEGALTLTSLHLVDHASLIFVPSSRYYQIHELETPQYLTEDLSEEFNKKKKIVVRRTVTCEGT